jgi:hypothetical protein
MIATDIFGRGVDFEGVNVIINYDMPDSSDSYLHRVNIFFILILYRLDVLEDLELKEWL